jgi:flagellar hook-associated protein 3 FlgL
MQIFRQGVDSILDRQSRLAHVQEQLSSGKRIVNPSDDPNGSARIIGLSESIKITEQYQLNIQQLRPRLQIEDITIGSVVDNLQRARELAVQGLNSINTAADRTSIAREIRQITDQVLGLANSKDGNGEFLFSGFQGKTIPFSTDGIGNFSYAGDQGQRQIQIGPQRFVADGDSGLDVFMKVVDASGAAPFEDVFSTLYNLATDLEANAPNANSLDQLSNAIDHLTGFRSTVGARLNAIDVQEDVNESLRIQLTGTLGDIEDVDIAEAASLLSLETNLLQAAQQAFVRVQNLNLFNFI